MAEAVRGTHNFEGESGGRVHTSKDSRSVCISDVPPMSFKEFHDSLSKFGPVTKIQIKYAVVTFGSKESAEKAIAAKSSWSTVTRMSIEKYVPNEEEALNLDNLPPNILSHLYRYLSTLDIVNVSETSDYLASFAEKNIYPQYADCRIFGSQHSAVVVNHAPYEWIEFKRILHHIGKHVTKMTLDATYMDDPSVKHLARVMRYCPNLDELLVKHLYFGPGSYRLLGNNNCSARILSFDCNEDTDDVWLELLHHFPKVKFLKIDNFSGNPDKLEPVIHSLQELNLYDGSVHVKPLYGLLRKTPTLRKLSLILMTDDLHGTNRGAVNQINLPQLEHLQISVHKRFNFCVISGLLKLKYLQILSPPDGPWNVDWSVERLPQLQELNLVNVEDDDLKITECVPTIRVLIVQYSKCSYSRTSGSLTKTLTKLPNVECLRIRRSMFCPYELAELVENRGNLTEIELDITPKDRTILMLKSLIERAESRRLHKKPRLSFALRILVDVPDPELAELTSQLSYASCVLTKDDTRVKRFDNWDTLLDERYEEEEEHETGYREAAEEGECWMGDDDSDGDE